MLLTDAEVQSFIQSGLMKIDLPDLDRIHHQVDARLRELNEMESHHGNNILPRMPILQYVLRHEKVHGALTIFTPWLGLSCSSSSGNSPVHSVRG